MNNENIVSVIADMEYVSDINEEAVEELSNGKGNDEDEE